MESTGTRREPETSEGYLDGQLLVAMPAMADPRFKRAVIYMCAHSADGAMGIIINQRARDISFVKLLEQLEIIPEDDEEDEHSDLDAMAVHVGGPVETGRGFVLHSSDYFATDNTLPIDESVCLTATVDILRAIASGEGPHQALLALGYAGWAAGQLETEIQTNSWLTCRAETDLIFDPDLEGKYEKALAHIGIDPSHLVSDAGHA
jgi:putative transcriptional regulator